jgi:hypothetical protein
MIAVVFWSKETSKRFLYFQAVFYLFFSLDLVILVLEIKKMCFRNFLTFSLFPKQVLPDHKEKIK